MAGVPSWTSSGGGVGPAGGGLGRNSNTRRRRAPPQYEYRRVTPESTTEDKSRNAANFECNVCFDMASDPVVTRCGHLFCWHCLYQWLHVHSTHRECPVCKGKVSDDAIIPIYGRGGSAASVAAAPPRPAGARVESSRQQQGHSAVRSLHDIDTDDDYPFNIDFTESMLPNPFRATMADIVDAAAAAAHYDDDDDVFHYGLLQSEFLGSAPVQELERLSVGLETAGHINHNYSYGQGDRDRVDFLDTEFAFVNNNNIRHHPTSTYSTMNSQNHGRNGRRQRARSRAAMSADQASANSRTNRLIQRGGSGGTHDAGSSRPQSGWAVRGGRSSWNSNQAGGRGGMHQSSRRQRTNNNRIIFD